MKKVGLPGMASNLPIEHVSGYSCYTAVIQKGRTTLMKQASQIDVVGRLPYTRLYGALLSESAVLLCAAAASFTNII
jgi:hypothetical protein